MVTPQLSEKVASYCVPTAVWLHCPGSVAVKIVPVAVAGQVATGGVLSITVTVKMQVLVLPDPSAAV